MKNAFRPCPARGEIGASRKLRGSARSTVRLAIAAMAPLMAARAQAPPILNSPYVCSNGITYTVTACKPFGTDQWCETVEKQNGNLVTSMDSSWRSMTGRLQGCTNSANAKPASRAASQNAAAQTTVAVQASAPGQQSFNPPYLREFPTADQIEAQLKGTSAQDTAYRQLTALHEFAQMIAALAGPRMAQNKLTPDEGRILTSYYNAYTALAKSIANPQDAYAGKADFTASLFVTFKMPTIQQLWETANNMTSSGQAGGNQLPATNDPTTLAARRCVELGGTAMQCLGGGISAGLQSLMGINLDAMTSTGKTGPVMYGTYNAASGLHFDFTDTSVQITGCGSMVQGAHNYTLTASGGKLSIKIDNDPQPFMVTLGADGRIAAPATQVITGQKIVGYFVTTNLKTGASTRQPNYGPDTETCKLGTLTPGPATTPDQGILSSLSDALSSASSLTSGNSASTSSNQILVSPGPRIVGTFTNSGGLRFQFTDASAVIDCAQAHVMVPYDVSIQGSSFNIAVRNGNSPIKLSSSGGSLEGTGTTTVNGKLMTGMDDSGNPILTPTSASCPVDSLVAAK